MKLILFIEYGVILRNNGVILNKILLRHYLYKEREENRVILELSFERYLGNKIYEQLKLQTKTNDNDSLNEDKSLKEKERRLLLSHPNIIYYDQELSLVVNLSEEEAQKTFGKDYINHHVGH